MPRKPKPKTPRPAGRPVEMTEGRAVNVYLDAESVAKAVKLGDGKISAGIREALRQAS